MLWCYGHAPKTQGRRRSAAQLLAVSVIAALALCQTACSTWPDPIGGGMAEYAKPALAAGQSRSPTARHLACSLTGLHSAADRADRVGRDGGQILVLREKAARAEREFAGLMPDDAERTLQALDHDLAALPIVTPAPRARAVFAANQEPCTA